MAEKKEKKEEGKGEGDAAAKPKKKSKKLFIIIGALVVLGAGAGVPLFLMGGEEPEEAHVEETHSEPHYEVVPLETFIVNLSQHNAFLKVRMQLELDHSIIAKREEEMAAAGEAVEAEGGGGHGGGDGLHGYLKVREPMIRDSVIRVLSSKRPEEVLSPDGKESLKEELVEALNEAIALDEPSVHSVLFAEFIVQ